MKYFWLYIYGPIAFIAIAVWTLICSAAAFTVSFFASRKTQDKVIAVWSAVIIKILGATVIVENRQKLPATGCLLIFNHLSFMDIPLIYHALGSDFRFGAKVELFRVPIFGHALKRFGFLPIERTNRSGTLKTYQKAKERSQNGERFILAPEGTRQAELKLGAFKSGPFILAIQAGIPLVPVLIAGPEKIYPKHKVLPVLAHKVILKVRVLDSISTNGYDLERRNELKDIAWQKMHEGMQQFS